jgi:hypothetical protein
MPTYISDYLKTTEGTEPCLDFHKWSMLMTLSVFAGRRFWFPFGPYTYYPNLYVVLVGDAGSCKSSAMNRAKDIGRLSKITPVAASSVTKEALLQKMSSTVDGKAKKVPYEGQRFFDRLGVKSEYNQYAIFATELTQFISQNPLGWIEFLTAIWDEPIVEVDTKNKGCDYVVGPYITMQACMTPDIVKGFLKMNILSSGFGRRTVWVYDSGPLIVPRPVFTQEQKEAEDRCIAFGQELQKRSGAFTCTDECWEYYDAWYIENKRTLKDKAPNVQSWYRSKAEMLFKISMLIALAETDELVISLPIYKLALQFCEGIESRMHRVFEGTGINPNALAAAQICRMLEAMPTPMNKKHVESAFFDQATSINELRDTISHLVNVGRLEERSLYLNGILIGTVIGTPESMKGRSDVELASFLGRSSSPPPSSETDSSPGDGPQP